jgi:hypothetical protein
LIDTVRPHAGLGAVEGINRSRPALPICDPGSAGQPAPLEAAVGDAWAAGDRLGDVAAVAPAVDGAYCEACAPGLVLGARIGVGIDPGPLGRGIGEGPISVAETSVTGVGSDPFARSSPRVAAFCCDRPAPTGSVKALPELGPETGAVANTRPSTSTTRYCLGFAKAYAASRSAAAFVKVIP